MAQNYVQPGKVIHAAASYPTTPLSGAPVVVGKIAGVALTNEGEGGNATGESSIQTEGVFEIPVTGYTGSTAAAVSLGDKLYFDTGVPAVNKNSSGVPYGKALGTISSGVGGLTDTIPVLLIQV